MLFQHDVLAPLDSAKAEELLHRAEAAEASKVEEESSLPDLEHDRPQLQHPHPSNDPEALYLLGRAHLLGLSGMAEDPELALAYFEVAARSGRHPAATEARDQLRRKLLCHLPEGEEEEVMKRLPHSKSAPNLFQQQTRRTRRRSRSLARIDSLDSGME